MDVFDIFPHSSTSKIVLTFLVAVCAYFVGQTVYQIYYHPLAKLPGPLLGKLTQWYMVYEQAAARATYTRFAHHRNYGSVVRLGPDEVSFSNPKAVRDIYGQSSNPCLKAAWFYHSFSLTGTHSVFAMTDRAKHSRVRRLISHGYSEQGMLQFENQIAAHIKKFLSVVEAASGKSVDVFKAANDLYLDVTSDLSFDKAFGMLDGVEDPLARDIQLYFDICPLYGYFPVTKYLPFGIFKSARQARARILQNSQNLIDQFRGRMAEDRARRSLLRLMVEARDEEDQGAKLSDLELIENAVIVIVAGSGTTATALTYIIYEIGKRPDMQRRLEKEIREAFPDQKIFPDFKTASKLVIQEVLRLRGPINTAPPRISPGKIIGDEYIPAGTIVSAVPYADARDPSIFSNPDEFLPERWADASPDMKFMTRPFSIGPRNCIGMHQVRMQLTLTVCALYQSFDISLDPRMNDENMAMRDLGLMRPIGAELLVFAKKRGTSGS